MVNHLNPYLSGEVTEADAAGLSIGLQGLLVAEAMGLSTELHFAALALLAIAKCGRFDVQAETKEAAAAVPGN